MRNRVLFVILILICLAVVIASFITWGGWTVGLFIIAIVAVIFVLFSASYGKLMLILSLAGLAVGWRGIPLWTNLRLYTPEVFLWTGLVMSLVVTERAPRTSTSPQSNIFPLLLALSTMLGVILGFANSNDPEVIVGQAKSMLVFLPALFLFRRWIHTEEDLLPCAVAMVVTGTVIAFLGTFEFVFPDIAKSLPWLFIKPGNLRGNFGGSGLIRLSGFSSWGTPAVGVMLVPAFGFWLAIRKMVPKRLTALSYLGATTIIVGIVLSGYRSAWGGMFCIAALMLFFDRKILAALILACVVIFFTLPPEFFDRMTTMWLLSQSGDSSLIRREYMLGLTMSAIQQNPILGTGWGSFSTYNDYAYLAVALGIPALVVFCLWYEAIIGRNWRVAILYSKVRSSESRINPVGFLAAMVGYLFCMMSGAMSFIQPLMLNFWLQFCLVLRYTEIVNGPVIDRLISGTEGTSQLSPPNRSSVDATHAKTLGRV